MRAPCSKLPGILVCRKLHSIIHNHAGGGEWWHPCLFSDGAQGLLAEAPVPHVVNCEDLGLHARKLHSIIHNHAGGGEWWHLVFV